MNELDILDLEAIDYTVQKFETDIFHAPVWRLENVKKARQVVLQAQKEKVALISCRLEEHKKDQSCFLEKENFYPVETLVTYEGEIFTILNKIEYNIFDDTEISLDIAQLGDAENIAALAENCFTHDRYHQDVKISNHIADEIKAQWMRNAVNGRADRVFILRHGHEIIGFNACLLRGEVAIIDLIAVSPKWQGRGLGKKLIFAMAKHYQRTAKIIRLGTQESNRNSRRFYEMSGFKEISRATTWHWIKV